MLDLGWPKVTGVECDVIAPVEVHIRERLFDELTNRVSLTSPEHQVLGTLLLQHQPHTFDILRRVSPVTERVEIPEEEFLLPSREDRCESARDLSRHKRFASPWRLVIEHDAVTSEQAVARAIIPHRPVGVKLGHSIWAARLEGRVLVLGRRSIA